MATVREQLVAARARIADPTHWTQGEYARDETGEPLWATADRACRWCAIGALVAENRGVLTKATRKLDDAAKKLWPNLISGEFNVAVINDGCVKVPDLNPHAAVLAVYDRAIADCGEAS